MDWLSERIVCNLGWNWGGEEEEVEVEVEVRKEKIQSVVGYVSAKHKKEEGGENVGRRRE